MPRLGDQCRQILGDQTRWACSRTSAMQPDTSGGGFERCHALRQQGCDGAGQDIARAGGGEAGRRIVIDDHAAIRRGDEAIRAFQHDNRAKPCRGSTRGAEPIRARRAEKPGEFAGMGRDHRRAAQQVRRLGSGHQGAGIGNQYFARINHVADGSARCLMRQKPRPGQPDLAPFIRQKRVQRRIADQLAGRIGAQHRGQIKVFGMQRDQPRAEPPLMLPAARHRAWPPPPKWSDGRACIYAR